MEAKEAVLLVGLSLFGFTTPGLAADDGAKILAEVCAECHTAKKNPLDKINLTRGEWRDTLDRMVGYGAEIPKGKIPELLDYLVKTHGPAGTTGKGEN